MKLEIKNNNFIEIEDLIKVCSIECTLDEYSCENKILKGVLKFQGEYLKDSSNFDTPFIFLKLIPVEIVFIEDIQNIKEVIISSFEYFEVERRGVETETTLLIIQEEDREVENSFNDEIISSVNLEDEYNNIKEDVNNEIENILDQTFNIDKKVENKQFYPTKSKRFKIQLFRNNK